MSFGLDWADAIDAAQSSEKAASPQERIIGVLPGLIS
jgi:hypothetical protein